MLKSVTVTNASNEKLVMPLADPSKSGLAIFRIEGLGPPKANINTTDLATADGAVFNSSRVTPRNIVISVKIMEVPTIEIARLRAYRYFPIKKRVKLEFETANRKVETYGYVETNEPNIFSNQETAQISILCPDPYFYATGAGQTIFSGVQPLFEFPFSNESLTEDLIEFGKIVSDTRADILYQGDADTGLTITIHALDLVRHVTIFNVETYETMEIDTDRIQAITGRAFGFGDDIIISTVRGSRSARLLRDGVYTNIISALNPDVDWFQITPGDNVFTFTAEEGINAMSMTFAFKTAYGGI